MRKPRSGGLKLKQEISGTFIGSSFIESNSGYEPAELATTCNIKSYMLLAWLRIIAKK